MSLPAVLHVVAPLGGGVDRYVRDIAAAIPAPHLLWHAGERAEVLETPAPRRFHPLDPARVDAGLDDLGRWIAAHGVGAVHLHSMMPAPRRRAQWIAQRLGIPLLVTLHDVFFLRADAFAYDDPRPDRAWTAQVEPLLRIARAVLAPSDYLAGIAQRTFEGLAVEVVPNGIAPAAPGAAAARPAFLERKPEHVVAVLGAIGTHKGADLLRALPPHLEGSGIGIVVIGYLDEQIYPGWNAATGAFVHGPYEPGRTAELLRAYGAELVLFPNLVPESFSYALSEAWAAGYPVLAGPHGAIGERVRRHGGGWVLPEKFGAAEVARELRRLASPEGKAERARVESRLALPDAERVPTLQSMAQVLDAYYRRYAAVPDAAAPPDPEAIQRLLATSLDHSLFRQELVFLADLCDDAGHSAARARAFEREAREWIAKLEGDVRTVQEQLRAETAERRRLATELAGIHAANAIAARLPRFLRRILAALFGHARG